MLRNQFLYVLKKYKEIEMPTILAWINTVISVIVAGGCAFVLYNLFFGKEGLASAGGASFKNVMLTVVATAVAVGACVNIASQGQLVTSVMSFIYAMLTLGS